MLTLTGKSLVTTDWHFGLKSNSENRIKILYGVTKTIASYMVDNKIDNLVFLGDWFHSRTNIAVNTMNIAISCMEKLSRSCKNVYLIVGNHDIFLRSKATVNSVNMFKHIKNVTIIQESTECEINGKRCLLVPWLGNLEYEKNTFDMAFGHFDINFKYLVNSFIEDNMKKNSTKEEMKRLMAADELLIESGLDELDELYDDKTETFIHREKSSDLIGDWIEIVKEKGTIFAGHIHGRKEFYAKTRRFIFVGSPYQQTRGERTSVDGFYILNEDSSYEFHEIKNTPRFIDIRISEILSDIDKFDYSIVKGNIYHKIYDVEIDRVKDSKISKKISSWEPFEEIPPDYLVAYNQDGTLMDSVDAIKRSKLDYLHLYINSIDDRILEEKNLNKDKLDAIMTEYYNQVIGD